MVFWVDQNIIKNGRIDTVNLLAYICFCLIFSINQIFAFLTMYYSQLAHLNKGVVSVIWGLNPLFIAFIDYLFYKQDISIKHYFGLTALVFSSVAIVLSTKVQPIQEGDFAPLNFMLQMLNRNEEH